MFGTNFFFSEATKMFFQPILSHLGPDTTPAVITRRTPPYLYILLEALLGNTSLTKNNHPLIS